MLHRSLSALVILVTLSFLNPAHAAPTCVTAKAGAAPTAQITFTGPTLQSDGTSIPAGTALTFNLYQGTASGAEVKVASTTSLTPIVVNTGLVGSTTYYWYVTVSDAGGESTPSNEVCKSFPAAVPGTITITIS